MNWDANYSGMKGCVRPFNITLPDCSGQGVGKNAGWTLVSTCIVFYDSREERQCVVKDTSQSWTYGMRRQGASETSCPAWMVCYMNFQACLEVFYCNWLNGSSPGFVSWRSVTLIKNDPKKGHVINNFGRITLFNAYLKILVKVGACHRETGWIKKITFSKIILNFLLLSNYVSIYLPLQLEKFSNIRNRIRSIYLRHLPFILSHWMK